MSFKKLFLALTLALIAGCGAGKIGDACDVPSGEGECEDGAVCTNGANNTFTCRKECTDQSQCTSDEQCNGVSGGSKKSCQPK